MVLANDDSEKWPQPSLTQGDGPQFRSIAIHHAVGWFTMQSALVSMLGHLFRKGTISRWWHQLWSTFLTSATFFIVPTSWEIRCQNLNTKLTLLIALVDKFIINDRPSTILKLIPKCQLWHRALKKCRGHSRWKRWLCCKCQINNSCNL